MASLKLGDGTRVCTSACAYGNSGPPGCGTLARGAALPPLKFSSTCSHQRLLFPNPNRLFDWLVSVINSSIYAAPDSWTAFIGSRAPCWEHPF